LSNPRFRYDNVTVDWDLFRVHDFFAQPIGQPSTTERSPADFAARIIGKFLLPMPAKHEKAPDPFRADWIAA
jgi:hypothetical protein